MLSPVFARFKIVSVVADMPVEVAKAPTPPSIIASFSSKAIDVGFARRVYIQVSCSRSKTFASSSQVSYLYVVL